MEMLLLLQKVTKFTRRAVTVYVSKRVPFANRPIGSRYFKYLTLMTQKIFLDKLIKRTLAYYNSLIYRRERPLSKKNRPLFLAWNRTLNRFRWKTPKPRKLPPSIDIDVFPLSPRKTVASSMLRTTLYSKQRIL